jgi:hypothetical protein
MQEAPVLAVLRRGTAAAGLILFADLRKLQFDRRFPTKD